MLTMTDVGNLVRKMNKVYQPKGKCSVVADRNHMQDLVDKLRSYTDQVQEEADSNGYAWISSSIFTPALSDAENMGQWITDMANWRERLAGYQSALDSAQYDEGIKSCDEIYGTVIGPLLDGNYSDAISTAGIVNPNVPTVNDVAFPYMLGNQVAVWQEFQRKNFEALINSFVEEGRRFGRKVARAGRRAAPSILAVGAGVAIGALAVGWAAGQIKGRS